VCDAVIESVLHVTAGPNAVSRVQFGMVRQPWFIGAVIGTVGGALWFALCVFSLWLCRRRQRRRKHPRSNGVVSGQHPLFIHERYSCYYCVNFPFHHKVQKFSSGTGSPVWVPGNGP